MNRVLALIPARGGSKRIPRKNIRDLCGRPLIAWTIDVANKSMLITETWVSTEDLEIAEIAKDCGAKVLYRPPELAQDDTPSMDVVQHALGILPDFDYVCLLQPTSPLRTVEDIDACIQTAFRCGGCVSVENGDIPNGAVYVWKVGEESVEKTFHEMPKSHSIDIDYEGDFKEAERLLKDREEQIKFSSVQ